MKKYYNYHCHNYFGNPTTLDVVVSQEDYCKRAIELGHDAFFTTCHGMQGNIFDGTTLAHQYNLKMIVGAEMYYVPNRLEKDKSNRHIILISLNNDGVRELNKIISEANETGFYYKPRIDDELLFSLNPKNIMITTACIAGLWNNEELIIKLKNHFNNNFFLEVQDHNEDGQKEVNKEVLRLHYKYNIPIIHANDSHYIYPKDTKYRDLFLKAKGIIYSEENNFILDYPDYDTIVDRYKKQGILSDNEIIEALDNTLIFSDVDNSNYLNDEVKLPSVSKNPKIELRKIIKDAWNKEKQNIDKLLWNKYEEAIKYEVDIIEKTNMMNYFIIDYKIVKIAQEKYNGVLTKTGRGCFTGEALIHTKERLKKLEEISIGDYVITEDGNFNKVLNTFKYEIKEPMVQIEHLYGTKKYFPTKCTLDHKILIYRNKQTQWVEAKNINTNDYVCVPKIKFKDEFKNIIDLNDYNEYGYDYDDEFIYEKYNKINSKNNKKIKRFLIIDNTLNKFIGLMYGDGYTNSTKNCSVGLALNTKNEKNTINRQIFYEIANRLNVSVSENLSKNKNLKQIFINSKVFTNFIKKELFSSKKGKEKTFNKKWFNQSKENIEGLIFGLEKSDGSDKENFRISFDNTSLSLINAYKLMCLYTNKGICSLNFRPGRIDNRGYNCKNSYKLRINQNAKISRKISERILEDNQYYYLPIKKVTFLNEDNYTVYDIEVENNHSYLINNMIVHNSAPSFYVTKLLGLTDIDRVAAPITLFPTRFMSVERILGAKSLPDIDLNTANADDFINASEDLLGKENCAWMIAWKPLQSSSAFRLYCKAVGEEINSYEDIAKELSELSKTKHPYTDSSYINDPKWGKLIEESRRFVGVVEGISESPCSELLYDKPVREEIGLIKTKTKICCLLDGYNCDKYKYLKNDYLTVQVWAIIRDVCKLVNIEIPSILELNELLDDKTFKIYENKLTCSINQADSDYATGLISKYKPKSVAEMSAFVAIIRPGCASLLNDFIDRKPYTTGVKELDNILQDGAHRMIYQELIMKYLIWLGIPETGSYDIIKKIAKKKFKEQELKELKEELVKGWVNQVGKEDGFEETWQVVNDAAKYSFNSSHSLSYAYDSLYGAYLKSHYPLEYYTVALNYYSNDEERTQKLIKELQLFNISLKSPKFGKSLATYFMDKDNNIIYKGIASIKYMNAQVAEELYNLSKNKYENFIDLLYDILFNTSTDARQIEILIKVDYFLDFGNTLHLLALYREFKEGKNRITKTLKEKSLNNRLEVLQKLEKDDTILVDDIKNIDIVRFKIKNGIDQDYSILPYQNREFIIIDINHFKNGMKAKASILQLSTGNVFQVKFKSIKYGNYIVNLYDHIYIDNLQLENKWYIDDDKNWKQYKDSENQKEYIVYKFEILNQYKEEKGDK